MSDTKHASTLPDRYPPGHEMRQTVARYLAGLRLALPHKRTVRVLDLVDRLDAESEPLGQILQAMASDPADNEPVTVSECHRNEKTVRYEWTVDR